jgi:hypothetical protein
MRTTARAALVVVALSLVGLIAQAQAVQTTLDFNGDICGPAGNQPCGDGVQIGQNYGDSAFVDVGYQSVVAPGNTAQLEAFLKWWSTGYSDLVNVVWGAFSDATGVSEIRLNPAPGFEVSLTSLDMGSWPNTSRNSQLTVFDDDYSTILYGPDPRLVDGTVHTHFALNLAYNAEGVRIQWGPSGFNVGLDNVIFDVRPINSNPTSVPAPASLILVGAALLAGVAYRGLRRVWRGTSVAAASSGQ